MLRSDRREPTQREIDDFVSRYLRVHRRVKEQSGQHVISDCPSCGKRKHLYLNVENGLWDCKRCDASGNLWQIADRMGVRIREAPISVVGAYAMMSSQLNAAPHAKSLPAEPQNAKGLDLVAVERACERCFNEADENGQKVLAYLRSRGFEDETIRRWRLGVAWIRDKGFPDEIAVGIPYVDRDKVTLMKLRNLESDKDRRKFRRVMGGASSLFNGESVRGLKQVVLVEGELDAVTLWQLGVTNVASTSLGSKKQIPEEWVADLKDAEDIVLWYDADEAGQDSMQTLMTQLGSYRCRIARIPEDVDAKDANDILKKHGDDGAPIVRRIVKEARGIENAVVVRPSFYGDVILSRIEQGAEVLGVSTGWASVDRIIRGLRPRETTLVTGHTAHGKTTWTTALMRSLVSRGYPSIISSLENGPESIVNKLFQTRLGYPISAISTDEKRAAAREGIVGLDDDPMFLIDRSGRVTIQEIGDDFRYARHRYGVAFGVIDHLHFLKKINPKMEMREHIDECLQYSRELAHELDMHIFMVAHPRGMDEDKLPSGDTVKETSSAKQLSDNGITVYRARDLSGNGSTKSMKIKNSMGARIPIELGPRDVMVNIWKTRSDDATEGTAILEFDRRTLCYMDKDEPAQAGEEEVDEFTGEPIQGSFSAPADPFAP